MQPRNEAELRRRVEKLAHARLSDRQWQWVEKQGYVSEFFGTDDEVEREDTIRRLVDYAEAHAVTLRPPADDQRWQLLQELSASAGEPLFQPIRLQRLTREGPRPGFGPRSWSARVDLRFDYRMSLRALTRSLGAFWPMLQDDPLLLRRTRPITGKGLELIRLVCLRMPDATWAARADRWNGEHRSRLTGSSLNSAFHRAERQLTGHRYGLAAFYWPAARLSEKDLQAAANRGDSDAKRWLAIYEDEAVGLLRLAVQPSGTTRSDRTGRSGRTSSSRKRAKRARRRTGTEPVEPV